MSKEEGFNEDDLQDDIQELKTMDEMIFRNEPSRSQSFREVQDV